MFETASVEISLVDGSHHLGEFENPRKLAQLGLNSGEGDTGAKQPVQKRSCFEIRRADVAGSH